MQSRELEVRSQKQTITLTGPIFVPRMAANWFQEEAMVRHDQSDG